MRALKKTAQAVVGLSVALLSGSALAAIPAPLVGTYVTYTFLGDPGIYGTVSLSGDDLVFAPTADFKALSANGLSGLKNKSLTIQVSVNDAYLSSLSLSGFSLVEGGSYSLSGSGAQAGVKGYIEALDIEGNTDLKAKGDITASGLGVIGGTHSWTGNAAVALPGAGWGGADGVVSSVNLTLSNVLTTKTVAGTTAEIWKNAVNLHVVTSPVPEAETYAMMLAGLGLVGFMMRRKRQATA